jgi:hypothetical protein
MLYRYLLYILILNQNEKLNTIAGLLVSQFDIKFGPIGFGSNIIGMCLKINFIIRFYGFCGYLTALSMFL